MILRDSIYAVLVLLPHIFPAVPRKFTMGNGWEVARIGLEISKVIKLGVLQYIKFALSGK